MTTQATNPYTGEATCSTCRFFFCHRSQGESYRLDEDGTITRTSRITEYRYCRRFPTPVTHEPWDWCGEHQPLSNNDLSGRR